MIYSVENEKIKVNISDKGAELQNIILKSDGCEYLWQGDAKYWAGRASNLFPICGRLTDGRYTYKGKSYEMNIHGFARNSIFKAERVSETKISFSLIPDEIIFAQYPFNFEFKVIYAIKDTEITVDYTVVNNGNEVMYFAVGGHPGFNVPLKDGEKFEDYYLEFDCVRPIEELVFTPLFNTGKTRPFELRDGRYLDLDHSLFSEDARFFTNMCSCVTLKSKTGNKFVRMEYPDMQNLGLWHAPGTEAPYICIEPWCSVPSYDGKVDDLETKCQMTKLEPASDYTASYKIVVG